MLNAQREILYGKTLTGPQRRRLKHKRLAHHHPEGVRCLRCRPLPRSPELSEGNPRDWSPPVQ